MTRELTASEVLQIAEEMERNAAKFYRRAAGLYHDPSLSRLFSELALKKERYTIGYYTGLTEFALGPENLQVIRDIVQEEKKHVRILTQSLNQAIG